MLKAVMRFQNTAQLGLLSKRCKDDPDKKAIFPQNAARFSQQMQPLSYFRLANFAPLSEGFLDLAWIFDYFYSLSRVTALIDKY